MVDLTIEGKNGTEAFIAKYLSERVKFDDALAEAVKKDNKTMFGVVNYLESEAKKTIAESQKTGAVCVGIDDEIVWGWAVHYILEDSLDFEKKEPQKKTPSEHPTTTPKKKKKESKHDVAMRFIDQLTFDF